MGKSHIGLTYSQEINEVLDQLTQMVRTNIVQHLLTSALVYFSYVPFDYS